MKIKSDRVWLKPIDESDIEDLRNWRNTNRDNFFDAGEISKEQQSRWYRKYQESSTDKMFVITTHNGERIGTIALYNIDVGNRTATLGRVIILEEFRGKGYAAEAVKLLTDYAFTIMRLWKIKVETHLDNIDAIAVYAKAGFKTTTRPIIVLEKISPDIDWRKPITLEETGE